MDAKERCKKLKEIRKKIADTIGIDLKQSECTFEGECKGTCPKCAKEEKILNQVLIGGTAAAAAVMLSACGITGQEPSGSGVEINHNASGEANLKSGQQNISDGISNENNSSSGDLPEDYDGGLIEEPVLLEGDVEYDPQQEPENMGMSGGSFGEEEPILLEGDVVYVPEEESDSIDNSGDSSEQNQEQDSNSGKINADTNILNEEELLSFCKQYTGAPIVEIDHYEGSRIVVHCYEVVDDGDGYSHTATRDWITYDTETNVMTNFVGDIIE